MPKKQKISARDIKAEKVKSLVEKVSKAKTMIFANYHGLTVNQLSNLRTKIKASGGEVIVAKNTLMKKALEDNKLTTDDLLKGPIATIFAYEDEIAPVKIASESTKAVGVPQFKFGFFGKDFLDSEAVENLAKIPSRPELQARVVGGLSSPLYGLVSVLSANIRNLVSVLDQVAKR